MATDAEREAQRAYWSEHSNGTVEAMMLDSKAAEIDVLERPEVTRLRAAPLRAVLAPRLSSLGSWSIGGGYVEGAARATGSCVRCGASIIR
jgi:hypothetical protein